MVSCVSLHIVARRPINYPRSSLITWTSWQDVPGRIHPTTRPCFLHAFPKDTSCPLIAKREIEHLFFTEKIESERVCVKWDRCVCVSALCDCDAFVCERRWQTTDQRSRGAVTNAWIEWLTAPNISPLLISRVFGDKSHPSHLKSGSATECWI